MSPMLFNMLLADIEEEMGRVKWRGVKLGKGRVYTLSYADDMVLLAENEEEMRSMMERLEEFFDRKRLKLNIGKTKIVRFRKGGGRETRKDWKWKEKRIEKVNEYKYWDIWDMCCKRMEANRLEKKGGRHQRLWGRYGG